MFNNIPYISLDENYNVIYAHDTIKKDYSGLLLPDFFRNLLDGYDTSYFSSPVEFDCGLTDMSNVRLIFFKDGNLLKCRPVRSRVYGDNRQRNVHYRLREPISSIFAMLPVIVDNINKSDSQKAVTNLETLNVQSYKLLKNVTNMSLVSRIMGGDIPPADTVDFSLLLNNITASVRIIEQDIKINCDIEDNIFIKANKSFITNAVLNLISNSINFKNDNFVEINIALKKENQNIVFSYSDNSKGVKAENIPFIFKPYYSKDPFADGENDPSLGLGLFIVKNAFTAAGGRIMTTSTFGSGIKYLITLPYVEPERYVLESTTTEFLLNRYSELYIQLCDSCQLPLIK